MKDVLTRQAYTRAQLLQVGLDAAAKVLMSLIMPSTPWAWACLCQRHGKGKATSQRKKASPKVRGV